MVPPAAYGGRSTCSTSARTGTRQTRCPTLAGGDQLAAAERPSPATQPGLRVGWVRRRVDRFRRRSRSRSSTRTYRDHASPASGPSGRTCSRPACSRSTRTIAGRTTRSRSPSGWSRSSTGSRDERTRDAPMPRPVAWIAVAIVLAIFGAYLAFTLANASYTLGCDYLAYDGAARRWLAGTSPYDAHRRGGGAVRHLPVPAAVSRAGAAPDDASPGRRDVGLHRDLHRVRPGRVR